MAKVGSGRDNRSKLRRHDHELERAMELSEFRAGRGAVQAVMFSPVAQNFGGEGGLGGAG